MASTFFDAFLERLSSATPIKNQSQLAKELNVGRSAISLAKQKDTVPSKWILKLATRYKLSSEWLASGTNASNPNTPLEKDDRLEPNIPMVHPKLDNQGNLVIDKDKSITLTLLTSGPVNQGLVSKLAYIQMPGPSMEPEIKNGDYTIIDQGQTEIYSGYIFAIAMEEQITVRRLEKGPGITEIHCENNQFSSFQIPNLDMDRIQVIGRVINIIRKYI